jgi:hypothetical protein
MDGGLGLAAVIGSGVFGAGAAFVPLALAARFRFFSSPRRAFICASDKRGTADLAAGACATAAGFLLPQPQPPPPAVLPQPPEPHPAPCPAPQPPELPQVVPMLGKLFTAAVAVGVG